jgi:uncharacterized phage infection (PIP) family protein YhgE
MAETTTQISRPAPFIETMGKTFGEGIMRLGAKEIPTAGFAPTVAPQIAGGLGQGAQQAAASQAGLGQLTFDPTTGEVTGAGQATGITGYQPFMDRAQTYGAAAAPFGTAAAGFGTAAAGLTGPGAGTGAGSIAEYMSPYTTNVIDAMQQQMKDVKTQQDISRNAQTVGAGAFGGARSGVAQSVADTEYNRMVGQMTAQQQGQSYQQAQAARQQDLTNQLGLGQYQQGLGQYQQGLGQYQQGMAQLQPGLAQQNIGMLQQGAQQDLSYRQAMADTAAQAKKMELYEPYQRYGFMGEQLTGIMGGYPGGTRMTTAPSASPMQQMMGMGIAGGLGYAGMQNLMG